MSVIASLIVRDLSICTPAGDVLVENASFEVGPGELVLLIGPSGSGKTSIVNLLCGLIDVDGYDWKATGTLTHGDRTIDLSATRSDLCGLVFQGHALFDDLSTAENLRIASDHAVQAGDVSDDLITLLSDIDPKKLVATCSGGQRQRIAIARTLLANHPVLILDEPNSGLDIKSSRRLASLVKDICRKTGKPAIIVAHHVQDLLPLADKVLLLDSRKRDVRPALSDAAAIEEEMMALETGVESRSEPLPGEEADWRGRLRKRTSGHWFGRYLAEYLWVLCVAPSMVAYLSLGGMILGFVSIWFGFNYHSFGGYLKSILHDETLAGIGFVQTTVAVPLIASILVVARNSAIISADLSNRVLSSQIKAMRNLNIPAIWYLVASIFVANVVSLLVLTAVSLVAASWAALQTWQLFFPDQPMEFWQENYFRRLQSVPVLTAELGWVLGKVLLSSAFGSAVAILIGLRRKLSVISINNAIAEAIVIGVSLTLLAHALVAILQFRG